MKKNKMTLFQLACVFVALLLILIIAFLFFLNKIEMTQKIYSDFLFFSPVFLILFSFICLIILFLFYLGFKNLFLPLKELNFFAIAISGGQRTYIKKDSYWLEELNTLQNAMQQMQDKIQQREIALFESLNAEKKAKDELLVYKNQLEEKIQFRTSELNTIKDKALAASSAKTLFLATMSHELRTPLNGIMGLTYLCLQKECSPTQKNYLKKIQHSASQLLKTINNILDFSSLDSGKFQLNHIPFHLKPLIENVYAGFKEQAKEKSIEYTLNLPKSIRENYEGDPFHLSQILNHLLSNAFKFTQKGFIHLNLQILESKQSKKDILLFKIQDSGLGIKKEHIQALFTGFNQGDSSFSRLYQGTGLGLALSKQLAELMEGAIQVESIENHGSTFYFTLKLQVHSLFTENETKKKDLKSFKKTIKTLDTQKILSTKKILLVEDNIINQEIALELLANIGLKTLLAENGIEALALSDKESFDLVLMDIQMPLMDGLKATRKLRKKGFTNPIIALSAHSSEEDIQQSIKSGMNDNITKPINPDIFKEKLLTYLLPH